MTFGDTSAQICHIILAELMQMVNSVWEFPGRSRETPWEVQHGEHRQFCSAVYSGPEGLWITEWASGGVLAHFGSSCYTEEKHLVSYGLIFKFSYRLLCREERTEARFTHQKNLSSFSFHRSLKKSGDLWLDAYLHKWTWILMGRCEWQGGMAGVRGGNHTHVFYSQISVCIYMHSWRGVSCLGSCYWGWAQATSLIQTDLKCASEEEMWCQYCTKWKVGRGWREKVFKKGALKSNLHLLFIKFILILPKPHKPRFRCSHECC